MIRNHNRQYFLAINRLSGHIGLSLILTFQFLMLARILWLGRDIPYLIYLVLLSGALYIITVIIYLLVGKPLKYSRETVCVVLLLIFSSFSLIWQTFYFDNHIDNRGVSSLDFAQKVFVIGVAWLFAGATVSLVRWKPSNIHAALIIGALIFLMLSALDGGLMLSYDRLRSETGSEDINHIYLGGSFMFLLFLAYASAVGVAARSIVFIASAFLLFAVGGRTTFILSLISIILFEYLFGSRGRIIVLFMTCLILGSLFFAYIDLTDSQVSHMFFSGDIESDSSFQERLDVFLVGIKALPSQALVGDVGFLVREFGSVGNYIHSLLSAWQFFGLLPFMLFVYLLWRAIYTMRTIDPIEVDTVTGLGILLLIYMVFAAVIAYSVFSYYLWFTIGFWCLGFNRGINSTRALKNMKVSQNFK